MVTPFSTTVVVSMVRPLTVSVTTLTLFPPPEKSMGVSHGPPVGQPPGFIFPESKVGLPAGLSPAALSKIRVSELSYQIFW